MNAAVSQMNLETLLTVSVGQQTVLWSLFHTAVDDQKRTTKSQKQRIERPVKFETQCPHMDAVSEEETHSQPG